MRDSSRLWAFAGIAGLAVVLLLSATAIGLELRAPGPAAPLAGSGAQGALVASGTACSGTSCVSLNRTSGPVGYEVTITGTGLPGTSVTLGFVFDPVLKLYLDNNPYPYNHPLTITLSSGGFTAMDYRLPLVEPGSGYRFQVYDSALTPSYLRVDYRVTSSAVSFSISPTTTVAGGCVLLTGAGFYPGDTENLYIGPKSGSPGFNTLTGFPDTLTGTISYILDIPATGYPAASYGLVAVGDTYGTGAAKLTISATGLADCASVSPTQGPVGATFVVTGTGFTASSGATVAFGSLGAQTPVSCSSGTAGSGSITTTAAGGFVCTFTIPSVAAGSYAVQAEDTATSTLAPTWAFEVTTPAITVSPDKGPVGSPLAVTGTGFTTSASVTLVLDSVSISSSSCLYSTSLVTSATGTFGCSLHLPSGTSGRQVIATDVTTGITATAKFTKTTPRITPTPNTGVVGSSVTVAGTGFTWYSTVASLVFDGVSITTCSTGSFYVPSGGAWSCTFSVPSGTTGTSVVATDQYGAVARTTYTVT